MHRTRSTTFVHMLNDASPAELKKYRETKHHLAQQGERVRLFDDFCNLLPEEELFPLRVEFIERCRAVKKVHHGKTGCELAVESDKVAVLTLAKIIVNLACRELINDKGDIKSDITSRLEWRKLQPEEVVDVVCAYVVSIYQAVLTNLPSLDKYALTAVLACINGQTEYLVRDQLHQVNTRVYAKPVKEGESKPSVETLVKIGGLVGLGLLTGIGVGLTLFKLGTSSLANDPPPLQDFVKKVMP